MRVEVIIENCDTDERVNVTCDILPSVNDLIYYESPEDNDRIDAYVKWRTFTFDLNHNLVSVIIGVSSNDNRV